MMDSHFGNSTLTNCGRMPEAFVPSDVNQFGLMDNHDTAAEIRDRMRELRRDDAHQRGGRL